MRTREKERIFKRFMAGESIPVIWANTPGRVSDDDIEDAIRDVIKSKVQKGEM